MIQEDEESVLQVQTVMGTKYRVSSAITLLDLKNSLFQLSNIPVDQQILIINGQIIKNDSANLSQFYNPVCILASKSNQILSAKNNQRYINKGLRFRLSSERKYYLTMKLMSLGLQKNHAQKCLKEASYNLLLAEQNIFNKIKVKKDKAAFILSNTDRLTLLKIFFQNPAWAKVKAKLANLDNEASFQLIVTQLKKYPFIYSIAADKLYLIQSLVLESHESSRFVYGSYPSDQKMVRLKRLTPSQVQKQRSHYLGLVDKELFQIFDCLGIDKQLAEKSLRASRNQCFLASRYILMGKIPYDPCEVSQKQDYEMRAIYYFVRTHRGLLNSKQQFDLKIASIAELHPSLFRTLTKYEGIFKAYQHFAICDPMIPYLSQKRQHRKQRLMSMAVIDVRKFYQFYRFFLMMNESSYKGSE